MFCVPWFPPSARLAVTFMGDDDGTLKYRSLSAQGLLARCVSAAGFDSPTGDEERRVARATFGAVLNPRRFLRLRRSPSERSCNNTAARMIPPLRTSCVLLSM